MRVLYLHGIGGPSAGSHSRAIMLPMLVSAASHVIAPNLQTDDRLHSVRRNGVLQHLARQPLLLGAIAAGVLAGVATRSATGGFMLAATLLFAGRKKIMRGTIDDMVASTLVTAEKALAHARATLGGVDVVVGQSWGGAVACLLVAKGLYDGPVLLAAPAVKPLLLDAHGSTSRHAFAAALPSTYPRSRMVCLSGTSDAIIDPRWLSGWCAQQGVVFVALEAGEHNLATGERAEEERATLLRELEAVVTRAAATAPPAGGDPRGKGAQSSASDTWRPGVDQWLQPSERYVIPSAMPAALLRRVLGRASGRASPLTQHIQGNESSQ